MNGPPQANGPFQRSWEHLLEVEQLYSNHAADPGGETMYGVTEWLARKYGYVGKMRDLPVVKARAIAKTEFWDPMSLDHVAWQSEAVARELLEAGYHLGAQTAGRMLQRALNAFGDGVLGLDGDIGPKTLEAMLVFLRKRGAEGERLLVTVLNALQCTGYVERVETDRRKAAFFYGWVRKRVRIQP
jgi:lysozyme family protein